MSVSVLFFVQIGGERVQAGWQVLAGRGLTAVPHLRGRGTGL